MFVAAASSRPTSSGLRTTGKRRGSRVEMSCSARSWRFSVILNANFGVSDRRFRFKPAGGFGGNRQAVSVQSGTPLRMDFGPDFGEPPLRDTSYLALACQSKYSCHYL